MIATDVSEYVVEGILDHVKSDGEFQFLTKWSNVEQPTWQPLSDFIGQNVVNQLLLDYVKDRGLKIPRLKRMMGVG